MKRFHLSIAVSDIDASVRDYSKRLGAPPKVIVPGRYALWRTEILNFSISCKAGQSAGVVRHIGFEDNSQTGFSEEKDVNGLTWETFDITSQYNEIKQKFPDAVYGQTDIV